MTKTNNGMRYIWPTYRKRQLLQNLVRPVWGEIAPQIFVVG
jgi:hypothetical protein